MNRNQRTRALDQALLSVVLPVFNEQEVLPKLVEQIAAAVAPTGVRYEIVFVNDGSSDDSPQILDELAASDPRVRVIHLARNFGHQAAVQAGLANARGDAVLLMDSDLQDAPDAIPRFLAEWQAGTDVVYAVRTDRKENALKRTLFLAFYRLLSAISSTPIPRDAGNFGLIDRRVAREIVALSERDRYYPGLRSWVGFSQRGIEVERNARYDDQPRVSFWGLVRLAKTAVFSFSAFPLKVFAWIGYTALAVFAGLSFFALWAKCFTELAIPGWTSYMLTGSLFGALNALGISILGEYVIRIYDQVRGRPIYVVDRIVGGHSDEPAANRTWQTVEAQADPQSAALLQQAMELLQTAASGARPSTGPADRPLSTKKRRPAKSGRGEAVRRKAR